MIKIICESNEEFSQIQRALKFIAVALCVPENKLRVVQPDDAILDKRLGVDDVRAAAKNENITVEEARELLKSVDGTISETINEILAIAAQIREEC